MLAHAICPVLVVRRESARDYRQALAAVDLGPRSDAVLRAALVVAAQASVTAFHAYQAPFEAKLRNKGFSEEDIACYTEPEGRAAERNIAALLADPELVGLNLKTRVVLATPIRCCSTSRTNWVPTLSSSASMADPAWERR